MGAVVLDLFAGSGALGLEALSRGAETAVFVERARPALLALGRNIADLQATNCSVVVESDVFRYLVRAAGGVTLVLADPPYGQLPGETLKRLMDADDSAWGPAPLVVIESGCRDDLPPPAVGWARWPSKTYGETRITIDEKEDER